MFFGSHKFPPFQIAKETHSLLFRILFFSRYHPLDHRIRVTLNVIFLKYFLFYYISHQFQWQYTFWQKSNKSETD